MKLCFLSHRKFIRWGSTCTCSYSVISCSDKPMSTGHTTWSADIRLHQIVSPHEFKEKIRCAMIRTRHLVPGIACTISLLPAREYHFEYAVPQSLEDAFRWTDAVVFFYEDPKSFQEAHDELYTTRWWRASDHRHTHELHVRPNPKSEQSWTVT